MDDRLKQRLVGAAVLVLAAVVFVPMLLDQDKETRQRGPGVVPAEQLQDTGARDLPVERKAVAAEPAPAEPVAIVEVEPNDEKRPVAAAAPPAPPVVDSGFAVQVGSFAKAANADGLREQLIAKGYEAFVKRAGSTTRVYVGPQSTRAEAEKALQALLADIKLKGIVVEFPR